MENKCRDCGECHELLVRVFECADHYGHVESVPKKPRTTIWIDATHIGGHDTLMCLRCLLSRGVAR